MVIYIDSEYRCHTSSSDGAYREFDVPFFDDKCTEMIEGYRYVPHGENWTREDGMVFNGEMIAPFKDFTELDSYQRIYERERLTDAENALQILYGGAV